MKTVWGMKIVSNDESQLCSLDELMRVFGSAKRYAFHRLLEGRNAKDIIQHLPRQFRLNKRFAEDAVLLAQSLISSQRELLPIRLEDVRVNQRNNIVGKTVRDVYDWLLQENVGAVVIENIQLRQRHDTDKRFHRLTHHFKKKKLTDTILRRGCGLGFASKK
jgi:IS605 OrfB family transposase